MSGYRNAQYILCILFETKYMIRFRSTDALRTVTGGFPRRFHVNYEIRLPHTLHDSQLKRSLFVDHIWRNQHY